MAFSLPDGVCGYQGIEQAVERCPFLRNIAKPTVFAMPSFQSPAVANGSRGPIFEDGPNFEAMFRLFHGRDGVVPLGECGVKSSDADAGSLSVGSMKFNPLVASAASITLSFGGAAGPFSFDSFKAKNLKKRRDKKSRESRSELQSEGQHEAMGSEWLTSGNCPIAKSYRAIGGVLPLVVKAIQPPSGIKYKCPPAIMAARKALAKTPAVKALRPQALPTKVLAIGAFGMMLNIPLGMWREHTKKFSPSWFVAVHATVPFVAMLRKAVVLPKSAMAFTIASAILGQAIGSRAERARLANLANPQTRLATVPAVVSAADLKHEGCGKELWVSRTVAPILSSISQSSVTVF